MRWGVEREEIEATMERIWDLHDDISEAILSVSKSRFLASLKSLPKSSHHHKIYPAPETDVVGDGGDNDGDDLAAAMEEAAEAKSLSAIRTALENLEDQLECFLTVHSQLQAERNTALEQLEQTRIVLAKRLAEYHGKKYKVIKDALAFVGSVHDKKGFVALDGILKISNDQPGENFEKYRRSSNAVMQIWLSSLEIVKKTINLESTGTLLGNGAVFAVSLFALLQLQRLACCGNMTQIYQNSSSQQRNKNFNSRYNHPCGASQRMDFDVMSARG